MYLYVKIIYVPICKDYVLQILMIWEETNKRNLSGRQKVWTLQFASETNSYKVHLLLFESVLTLSTVLGIFQILLYERFHV